ncbi:MAG: glycosyltransferase [Candidatus Cloacimonetes bacterium]|nr:glycosyltransferase [Candidatus Cloacimonadota bacterium]
MIYLFWVGLLFLIYHLVFYPLLLMLLAPNREQGTPDPEDYPAIAIICPAYNEESSIGQKIESFLKLDYPADKLDLYIVSDGSQDATVDVVRKYEFHPSIHLITQLTRQGKSSAFEAAFPLIKTDLILATDANAVFHPQAVRELADIIISDPVIGIVVGKLEYTQNPQDTGEIIYWNYETWLKNLENKFNSIICANGSIYLIRKKFCGNVHPAAADDFERTLMVLEKQGRVVFNPQARVREPAYSDLKQLIASKTRNINRQWFAMKLHLHLLNPFRYPRISFQLFSHKILRWLLPLFSISILLASGIASGNYIWNLIFAAQLAVYLAGLAAILMRQDRNIPLWLRYCGYWLAMNIASLQALVLFITGYRYKYWETFRRSGNRV